MRQPWAGQKKNASSRVALSRADREATPPSPSSFPASPSPERVLAKLCGQKDSGGGVSSRPPRVQWPREVPVVVAAATSDGASCGGGGGCGEVAAGDDGGKRTEETRCGVWRATSTVESGRRLLQEEAPTPPCLSITVSPYKIFKNFLYLYSNFFIF